MNERKELEQIPQGILFDKIKFVSIQIFFRRGIAESILILLNIEIYLAIFKILIFPASSSGGLRLSWLQGIAQEWPYIMIKVNGRLKFSYFP